MNSDILCDANNGQMWSSGMKSGVDKASLTYTMACFPCRNATCPSDNTVLEQVGDKALVCHLLSYWTTWVSRE